MWQVKFYLVLTNGAINLQFPVAMWWQMVAFNLQFYLLPCLSKWMLSTGSYPQQYMNEWLPPICSA
jgi:hypothetical protein